MSENEPITESLFNTPVESGLRSLFVLTAVYPQQCDLQRLVVYDYFLVHSADVAGGPFSLHPAAPLRTGELLVRRNLIESGLRLLIHKGLVGKEYVPTGIYYAATNLGRPFLSYFQTRYANRCREISEWIAVQFQSLTDEELKDFINENLGRVE